MFALCFFLKFPFTGKCGCAGERATARGSADSVEQARCSFFTLSDPRLMKTCEYMQIGVLVFDWPCSSSVFSDGAVRHALVTILDSFSVPTSHLKHPFRVFSAGAGGCQTPSPYPSTSVILYGAPHAHALAPNE